MRSRRRNRLWLAIGVAFLTLLGTAQLADVSEAAVQTCVAGPVYDPACDVDHDGDVDVLDIQLAAGHWNQSGTWTGGDYWSLAGNAATNPTVNFLGTTDRQALVVRTNNTERLRVTDNGLVGIGTASPVDQLSVRKLAQVGQASSRPTTRATMQRRYRRWYRMATAAPFSAAFWTQATARRDLRYYAGYGPRRNSREP